MNKFIDKQEAIDALGERPDTWTDSEYELGKQNQYDADLQAILNLKKVDAVEVVRCKDCKWFDPTSPCGTIAPLVFECRLYGTFHFTEFFCGCGERKSEEDPSHPCADSVMMGE